MEEELITFIPDYIIVGGYEHEPIEGGGVVVYEERSYFLPIILKKYGFVKSMREIRKHRPDLWRYIRESENTSIEIKGKVVHVIDGYGREGII